MTPRPTHEDIAEKLVDNLFGIPGGHHENAKTLILSALAQAAPGWRPLATAPIDEPLWLWAPTGRNADDGRAFEGVVYQSGDRKIGTSSMCRGIDFTHWMPLPPAPSPEKKD